MRIDFLSKVKTDLGIYTTEEDLLRYRHIYKGRKVVNLMVEVERDSNFDFNWEHKVWVYPGYATNVLDVKNNLLYADTLAYITKCLSSSNVGTCVLPMRNVSVKQYKLAISLLFSRYLERFRREEKKLLFVQDPVQPMGLGHLLLSARESGGVVEVLADPAVFGSKHIETFRTMKDRVEKIKRSMAENLGFSTCFISGVTDKWERTSLGNGNTLVDERVSFASKLKFRHSFVHTGDVESDVNVFEKIRELWY